MSIQKYIFYQSFHLFIAWDVESRIESFVILTSAEIFWILSIIDIELGLMLILLEGRGSVLTSELIVSEELWWWWWWILLDFDLTSSQSSSDTNRVGGVTLIHNPGGFKLSKLCNFSGKLDLILVKCGTDPFIGWMVFLLMGRKCCEEQCCKLAVEKFLT